MEHLCTYLFTIWKNPSHMGHGIRSTLNQHSKSRLCLHCIRPRLSGSCITMISRSNPHLVVSLIPIKLCPLYHVDVPLCTSANCSSFHYNRFPTRVLLLLDRLEHCNGNELPIIERQGKVVLPNTNQQRPWKYLATMLLAAIHRG